MRIHVVGPGQARTVEPREIKPGSPLVGTAITRVELTFADLDYEHLGLYLSNTILPRLVPDPNEPPKRWDWE